MYIMAHLGYFCFNFFLDTAVKEAVLDCVDVNASQYESLVG